MDGEEYQNSNDYPDALSSLKDSRMIFHGVQMVPIRRAGLVMVKKTPIVTMPANAISAGLHSFLMCSRF